MSRLIRRPSRRCTSSCCRRLRCPSHRDRPGRPRLDAARPRYRRTCRRRARRRVRMMAAAGLGPSRASRCGAGRAFALLRALRVARGFSLLEAMIALVVLSVGMIGIAALHGHSLSAARSAHLRTQAVNLVSDMADRIRVNPLGGAAYGGPAANQQCDPESGGAYCTPEQMAAHDLFVWQKLVSERLPNGVGTVTCDATTMPPTY